MKNISIILLDKDTDTILTDGSMNLPSSTFDEQQISGFDAALKLLSEMGYECCAMTRVFNSESKEIWQALSFAEMLNFEGNNFEHQWIATNFVDHEAKQRQLMENQ